MRKYIPSTLKLLRVCHEKMLFFFKYSFFFFFYSDDHIIFVLHSINVVFTNTDLYMLNYPQTLGINLIRYFCIIL